MREMSVYKVFDMKHRSRHEICCETEQILVSVAHVQNMAEQIDPKDTPPPIKHKALLNVDLGEAVSNSAMPARKRRELTAV